jgi:peptidoglycan/LPS O-acetylase OafA/YrhL
VGRIPSLDGWRAVSIVFVLLSHASASKGFPPQIELFTKWFSGELGVQIFFTISGFLITLLLLREFDTSGSINLRAFYERRALRILPVYFAFVLVMLFMQFTTIYRGTLAEWMHALTFTANYAPPPPQ